MQRKIKSHTKRDIQEWAEDLEVLPGKIDAKTKEICIDEVRLADLNADLQSHLDSKIFPTQADIDALQARIYVMELPHKLRLLILYSAV